MNPGNATAVLRALPNLVVLAPPKTAKTSGSLSSCDGRPARLFAVAPELISTLKETAG